MRRNRLRIWVIRPFLVAGFLILSFLAWNHATANFGTVTSGQVYRSGQMSSSQLAQTVQSRSVKTVLNLRGHHPEEAWYRKERDAALASGAIQVDMALSSCEWMSRYQARTLVDLLDNSERPILIHCFHGSERTGLVSAFSELLRPGSTLANARNQFSLIHLYLPVGDGIVMPQHLDQYENWLKQHGRQHSPDQFRLWIQEGYTPGLPSRESWPYDPYPLKVVSKKSELPGEAIETKMSWTPGSEPGSPKRMATLSTSAPR